MSTASNSPDPSAGAPRAARTDPRGAVPDPSEAKALAGYEVLVCISGGIAAYKTATLVSQLVQFGCGVTVALTRNARRFVGEVTFRGLTGRPVYSDPSMWHTGGGIQMRHLGLTEAADLVVVAPATANVIGKLAGGLADDFVSTLLLGADSPVLLAPAMNERMWQHAAVRRNVTWLRESGVLFVGPEEGWLACRAVGPGRMSEPEALLSAIRAQLLKAPPKSRRT